MSYDFAQMTISSADMIQVSNIVAGRYAHLERRSRDQKLCTGLSITLSCY